MKLAPSLYRDQGKTGRSGQARLTFWGLLKCSAGDRVSVYAIFDVDSRRWPLTNDILMVRSALSSEASFEKGLPGEQGSSEEGGCAAYCLHGVVFEYLV